MEELYIKDNAKHRGVPIIRDESHAVLIDLIKQHNPKHILEIGTAVGYSGIAMLQNCDGELITIEHNENLVDEAKRNFEDAGLSHRVKTICDDCLVQVALMVADDDFIEYFDFIFLDGPKAQYQNMIDGLMMLLKPNGIILIDNVLFRGYVDGSVEAPTKRFKTITKRLKTFIDEFLKREDVINPKLIKIEDGMLLASKK